MNRVELKKKMPKLLILPLIILFSFSIYSGLDKFKAREDYSNTHKYIHFATISSDLIHELEKERGYSSGFAASHGKSFLKEVKEQREKSDKKIKLLKKFLANFDSTIYKFPFQKPIHTLLHSLDKINEHRVKIDNQKIQSSETINYYTKDINILLKLLENIITISHDSELTVLTQSYITLMKIKEKAGIERALINRVFSQGKLSNNEFYTFGGLVTAQEIYVKYFQSISQKKYVALLNQQLISDNYKEINKERNIVFAKNQKNEILSSIKEYVGYGGLIHDFKNYVIRGNKRYLAGVKTKYSQLIKAINRYKSIDNITQEEIKKLDIIKNVFTQYLQGLVKITRSYKNGGSIPALDKIVKVDDTPAIKALHDLTTNIYGSQTNWFKHSSHRINSLKQIEDKMVKDINLVINSRSNSLLFELLIQILILCVVLVIILMLFSIFKELMESEKRLNRAQYNTKSGSYEYHLQDNLLIWSDEHYHLLKVKKDSFIPSLEKFINFIHPDDVNTVREGLDTAASSHSTIKFEYRIRLLDKTQIYVSSSAEVIKYNTKGEALIIVGTITDISESKKLEAEIIETQKDVVFTMGSIGETRSKETGQHVKRVAEYSKLLYLLTGVKKKDAELLKMASPMHDIGKVGIPDNILNKPGKLTPGEWAIMQTHSEMGYNMLKNSNREILKLAATVALSHHEKYDGSGYPKGLAAHKIPMVGRITALADVFDALGSDRCYKTAWDLERILTYIKEERAKHFDPQLVDLFIEHLEEFLEIRDKYKDSF